MATAQMTTGTTRQQLTDYRNTRTTRQQLTDYRNTIVLTTYTVFALAEQHGNNSLTMETQQL